MPHHLPQQFRSIYILYTILFATSKQGIITRLLCFVSLCYLYLRIHSAHIHTPKIIIEREKHFLSNILFVLYLFYGKYIVLLFSAVGVGFSRTSTSFTQPPFLNSRSVYIFWRCFCTRKWRHEIYVEETCNNNITTSIIQV